MQSAFINKVFRVYTSPDILGIELGGSLKNVIALAAGIADGLGYGDNTKAALITRGIAENCQTGREDGREDRDVHRFDGNRRFDRYVRQRPQQKPESRISYRTGKVNAGSNG